MISSFSLKQEAWVFATSSDFPIPVSFKLNFADLRYFRPWILLDQIIGALNINGLHHRVAKIRKFKFGAKTQIICLEFLFMYYQITSFLLTFKHFPVFQNQPTSPLKKSSWLLTPPGIVKRHSELTLHQILIFPSQDPLTINLKSRSYVKVLFNLSSHFNSIQLTPWFIRQHKLYSYSHKTC